MLPDNKSLDTRLINFLDVSQSAMPVQTGHLNLGGRNPQGQTIEFTSYYLLKNSKPCIPTMGEFHFSRYAHQYWEEELLKMKAGGIEIIATYVFWIHIEEEEGIFDWSGNNNLREFVRLCAKHDLPIVVRIGPFAHGECRNGGLPDWLYGRPFTARSNDARYLLYVERFYRQIAIQLDGLLFKDDGPVLGIQIENEYMHAGAPWEVTFRPGVAWVPRGEEGVSHMQVLKKLAQDVGLDVPLYTCTGWLNSPVPEGELLPMQGGYAFTPWSPDPAYRQSPTREFLFRNRYRYPVQAGRATYDTSLYPLACCEIGGGIQDTYYHRNIVPPESVEALAVMNLAGGANIIGYYMYHGGTNPIGKHNYMNEFTVPRVSYDFQAPLREFGQVADSYRSLRILHLFLKDFGELLAPMTVILPSDADDISPENTRSLRYAARAKDGAGFLFLNNYQDHVEMADLEDIRLSIQTADEIISLPYAEPLTLRKNTTAVLPFGLTLDGIRLKYATTQLLTRLETDDAVTYFFFAPDGMHSEYAFDSTSYQTISVQNGDIVEKNRNTYVAVTSGIDCIITVKNLDNKQVRIITLTRDQAEHSAKHMIGQQARLVITEGTFVSTQDGNYLYSVDEGTVSLLIFPALDNGQLDSNHGRFTSSIDGLFFRYTLSLSKHPIALNLEMIDARRASLKFAPDILDGVNNVFLRIEYVGDIGNAYIDGKLISDNFYNGTVWEIGLKHFAGHLRDKEMVIVIDPIRPDSGVTRYIPTGMAFQQAPGQEGMAVIRTITAVPEFRINLDWLLPGSSSATE